MKKYDAGELLNFVMKLSSYKGEYTALLEDIDSAIQLLGSNLSDGSNITAAIQSKKDKYKAILDDITELITITSSHLTSMGIDMSAITGAMGNVMSFN